MIRIHYLQHVPFEGLGHIEIWARRKGHPLSVTRLYGNEALPDINAIDWLVVMGGPMNVYEEAIYPWLAKEKAFIGRAMEKGKIVLGICLGAQLIATVAGGRVFANPQKEIGWFPVSLSETAHDSSFLTVLPDRFDAFHWHGDTFDIPHGAVWLAQSEGCRNQAFSLGKNVLALQFHLESTEESIEKLIAHCGNEITPGPYIQRPQEMPAETRRITAINGIMDGILERFENITLRP